MGEVSVSRLYMFGMKQKQGYVKEHESAGSFEQPWGTNGKSHPDLLENGLRAAELRSKSEIYKQKE